MNSSSKDILCLNELRFFVRNDACIRAEAKNSVKFDPVFLQTSFHRSNLVLHFCRHENFRRICICTGAGSKKTVKYVPAARQASFHRSNLSLPWRRIKKNRQISCCRMAGMLPFVIFISAGRQKLIFSFFWTLPRGRHENFGQL